MLDKRKAWLISNKLSKPADISLKNCGWTEITKARILNMSDSLEESSIKAKIELTNSLDLSNYSSSNLSPKTKTAVSSDSSIESSSEKEEEILTPKTKKLFTKKKFNKNNNYKHIKAKVPTRDIIPR